LSRVLNPNTVSVVGVVASAGWAVAALAAMVWGKLLVWPDFVHTDYGFPLTFATHTTDTFVGPVDKWSLDLGAFTTDLSFWIAGMLVLFVGFLYLARRAAGAKAAIR